VDRMLLGLINKLTFLFIVIFITIILVFTNRFDQAVQVIVSALYFVIKIAEGVLIIVIIAISAIFMIAYGLIGGVMNTLFNWQVEDFATELQAASINTILLFTESLSEFVVSFSEVDMIGFKENPFGLLDVGGGLVSQIITLLYETYTQVIDWLFEFVINFLGGI